MHIEKTYADTAMGKAPNEIIKSVLTLELLQTYHEDLIRLKYYEAYDVAYINQIKGQSNNWMDKAVDLKMHELSMNDDGIFTHLMEFDRGGFLSVSFSGFSFEYIKIASN